MIADKVDRAIWTCRPGNNWYCVDEKTETIFFGLENFIALSIFDICGQKIPAHDGLVLVAHWHPSDLEPAEDTVMPSASVFHIEWHTRLARLDSLIDHALEIVRMDDTVVLPIPYLLKRHPVVIQETLINHFQIPISRERTDQPRDRVYDKTKV